MEKISFENYSFAYKNSSEAALKNINLNIKKGEFIIIAGKSGSGKSTLLKQLKPSLSDVGGRLGRIIGDEAEDPGKLDRLCGLVMQSPTDQFVSEYVWHEIAFGLESRGEDPETIRRKVAETASFLGVEDIFGRKVSELSDGQRQIVALASIAAMEPEVLLLDEATSRLDPFAQHNFMAAVSRLRDQFGITVVAATHHLDGYVAMCDRIVFMDRGRIVIDDRPEKAVDLLYGRKDMMFFSMPAQCVISRALEFENVAMNIESCKSELNSFAKKNLPVKRDYPSTEPTGKRAVEVKDLSFSYDGREVLRDLNLSVRKGEICAILGGNASGKTTLLNILSGLEKKYSGRVKVEKEYGIYYIPQDPRVLFSQNTVASEISGHSKTDEKARDILSTCGLEDLATRHPYDLSGGEQQRLAIAKMLMEDSDIILMDEPTKGIDYINKVKLGEIIRDLKIKGKTVIIVSHDTEFCAEVSDTTALLFDGSILSKMGTRDFIKEAAFYTTGASRISRDVLDGAITDMEVIEAFNWHVNGFSDQDDKRGVEEKVPNIESFSWKEKKVPYEKNTFLLPIFAATLMVLAVFFEYLLVDDKRFLVIAMTFMAGSTGAIFLLFEKSRPEVGEVVMIAVMSAIAVAGRAAFFATANFKPVLAVVIIAGFSLGKRAGFITGALSMLISNFMFGQGSWTMFQMFAAGVIGFLAGCFNKKSGRIKICLFGALAAIIIYGGIVNPSYILTYQSEITLSMLIATYVVGLPLDITHAIATFVFLWIGFLPMKEKIERAKLKYNID